MGKQLESSNWRAALLPHNTPSPKPSLCVFRARKVGARYPTGQPLQPNRQVRRQARLLPDCCSPPARRCLVSDAPVCLDPPRGKGLHP
jgi:hypothetical protein